MDTPTPRISPSDIRTPTPTPAVTAGTPGPIDVEGTPAPVPDAYLAAMRADLEARGVATDDLSVASSEAVTWRDGSLGCPREGMAYTQALEPGMRVVVSAGGQSYDYRFGTSGTPRLCEPAA